VSLAQAVCRVWLGRVTVKLGPRYDMGDLAPSEEEGWKRTLKGGDWAIWEKQ